MMKITGTPVLSERTLLLDVGYRPLSIVSVWRALLLLITEKAETVHESHHVVRSERLEVIAPSIARLRYQVAAPYRRRAPLHRKAVFARDAYLCQYCGRRAECLDHVYPRSKGGEHEWENVVASCGKCNLKKSDLLLTEVNMKLIKKPFTPTNSQLQLVGKKFPPNYLHKSWMDYVYWDSELENN